MTSSSSLLSMVTAHLDLFINEAETMRLLGVPGTLKYILNGTVNDYALEFNVPLAEDMNEVFFDWQNLNSDIIISYSIGIEPSKDDVLMRPQLTVPQKGRVPYKLSTFGITLSCKEDTISEVEVGIRFNFNLNYKQAIRPNNNNINNNNNNNINNNNNNNSNNNKQTKNRNNKQGSGDNNNKDLSVVIKRRKSCLKTSNNNNNNNLQNHVTVDDENINNLINNNNNNNNNNNPNRLNFKNIQINYNDDDDVVEDDDDNNTLDDDDDREKNDDIISDEKNGGNDNSPWLDGSQKQTYYILLGCGAGIILILIILFVCCLFRNKINKPKRPSSVCASYPNECTTFQQQQQQQQHQSNIRCYSNNNNNYIINNNNNFNNSSSSNNVNQQQQPIYSPTNESLTSGTSSITYRPHNSYPTYSQPIYPATNQQPISSIISPTLISTPNQIYHHSTFPHLLPPPLNSPSQSEAVYHLNEASVSRSDVFLGEGILEGFGARITRGQLTVTSQDGTAHQYSDVLVKMFNNLEKPMAEACLLRHLTHPNLTLLLASNIASAPGLVIYEDSTRMDNLKLFLGGRDREVLNPQQQTYIVLQIARGLSFMHGKGILHKDVATRNCWINNNLQVKLGDSFLSCDLFPDDFHLLPGRGQLPVRWSAPEVIQDDSGHTYHSDVWSLGVLAWETFSLASTPYEEFTRNSDVIDHVIKGYKLTQPRSCPNEMYMMTSQCWNAMPTERINLHQFITFLFNFYDALSRFV